MTAPARLFTSVTCPPTPTRITYLGWLQARVSAEDTRRLGEQPERPILGERKLVYGAELLRTTSQPERFVFGTAKPTAYTIGNDVVKEEQCVSVLGSDCTMLTILL